MDIDLSWNNIEPILRDYPYTVVVGCLIGYFLYKVVWRGFELESERVGRKQSQFCKALPVITFILVALNLFCGLLGCIACAFLVSGGFLWWRGFFMQHGTGERNRQFIKKRLDLYNSMNDERLVVEAILYRVDKHYEGLLGKVWNKIIPVVLTGLLKLTYDSIKSPSDDLLKRCLDYFNSHAEMVSAMLDVTLWMVIFVLINYTELQTRRHIIEYQIEARGLKNRLYNTIIKAKR